MPRKQTPDSEIVEKLRARDPEGIAAAYDRYGRIAYSIFLRITHDNAAAEDLVQELFLRVWNRARDFDASKGSLSVWILSIARNIGIDYARSAQSRFQNRLRPLDQTDPLAFSYQSKEPELFENAKSIREALSELTANQRQVLELAYFEGFSQSEIARKLQQPLGTVKSWMRSALGRLRAAMKTGVTE
ncbi:MAG TPA: sigma-70 family RNA polymerase sigma factor [Bryobacteraceae bacterium]|jgi:RNA polymerase sigma-70 factor (ECF subfamily)|nr:sigma-70 family RNA polymerase sigma factor [Bryobacteraceae bacterium]